MDGIHFSNSASRKNDALANIVIIFSLAVVYINDQCLVLLGFYHSSIFVVSGGFASLSKYIFYQILRHAYFALPI